MLCSWAIYLDVVIWNYDQKCLKMSICTLFSRYQWKTKQKKNMNKSIYDEIEDIMVRNTNKIYSNLWNAWNCRWILNANHKQIHTCIRYIYLENTK